jgi:hypothetical protein
MRTAEVNGITATWDGLGTVTFSDGLPSGTWQPGQPAVEGMGPPFNENNFAEAAAEALQAALDV